MKIEDFRNGDVILFHTPIKWYSPMSWLSGLIRVFTKCRYNHVGVVVENWGVPFLNEALASGIINTPLKDRLDGRLIRVIRPINTIDEYLFAIKANDKLGKTPYDFSGLLWFQLIYQLTGHWLGHTGDHADKRMYCGEYVAYMYSDIFERWWQTAPSDIHKSKEFLTLFEGQFTNN
jgi:hypothetical protein